MRNELYQYRLLWLLVFSFIVQDARAQLSQFSIKIYSVKDGLPDSYVRTIFQDSRGFFWIGTSNGMSRFDGKNFVNYNLGDGLPSLSSHVDFEDSLHRLWVVSPRGMTELRGDGFHTYPLSDSMVLTSVFAPTYIKSLGLVVPTSHGIYRFDNDHWEKLKFYPGLENNFCMQLIDTNEGLYFNYGDHLVLKKKDNSYELIGKRDGKNGPYFRGMHLFDDTLNLATEEGLFKIIGDRKIPIFEHDLHDKTIYAFYKDSKHRYWICTNEDGLLVSEPGNTKEFAWRIPVVKNLISGILEDRSGNIWLACIDGLGLVNEKKISRFTNHLHDTYTILETPDKNILIYSRPYGFMNFSGNDFKTSSLSFPLMPGYEHNNDLIDYYFFDDLGRVWFSTRYQKLFCLDHGLIKNYSSLTAGSLTALDVDYNFKKRRFSVAADTFKVGNERSLQNFVSANTHQMLIRPVMNHSFSNGLQVVTTAYDGTFLIDDADNAILINKELQVPKTSYALRFIEEDNGKFWIYNNGTGISRYHWNANHLPEKELDITTVNGLPSNTVSSMCIDKYKRVWASTFSGVMLIRLDSTGNNQHSIYDIGTKLEIPLDYLRDAKLLNASDGTIWLSKPSEIYHINPDDIVIDPVTPSISIQSIRVFSSSGKPLEKFKSLQHYWIDPSTPVLSYHENNLEINFTGISIDNYAGLQYSFKLEGLDTNWSQPAANTSITYVKLSPGHYTFNVRVKNTSSGWSVPASFSFSITTPFWETWWFRLAVILAASALIVFIFRYRLRQLKTKTEMQNQIRELEMKALKAQMNPHFIHNALNSIQSLMLNNQSTAASHYISKFAKLLRQVLESADRNLISLDKELYSLQLYVDLEKLRMNMDIDYKEQVDAGIIASEIKIPPLILQPFVENALWHGLSRKEGDKKITVSITGKDNWIICNITDNGIGRKKAAESYKTFPEGHLSKAVNITQQRLADFNQSPGTQPVSFIDLEKDNEALGTTVIIRIKAGYNH